MKMYKDKLNDFVVVVIKDIEKEKLFDVCNKYRVPILYDGLRDDNSEYHLLGLDENGLKSLSLDDIKKAGMVIHDVFGLYCYLSSLESQNKADYLARGNAMLVRFESNEQRDNFTKYLIDRYDFSGCAPLHEYGTDKGISLPTFPGIFANIEGHSCMRVPIGVKLAPYAFNRWFSPSDFLTILDIVYRSPKIQIDQRETNMYLYKALMKEKINHARISSLIKDGADPLGFVSDYETVYSAVIEELDSTSDEDTRLRDITEILLQNGMKIKKENLLKDTNGEVINPFWFMTFLSCKKLMQVLPLFVNDDLDLEAFDDFVSEMYFDILHENVDECFIEAIRKTMFISSFEKIWKNDSELRELMNADENKYDMKNFRNPFDFKITYDCSNMKKSSNNEGVVIYIYESKTNKMVWKTTVHYL